MTGGHGSWHPILPLRPTPSSISPPSLLLPSLLHPGRVTIASSFDVKTEILRSEQRLQPRNGGGGGGDIAILYQ